MPSLSGIRAASPLNADDTTYLVHAADTDADVQSSALDNMPSDFSSMDTGLQMDVVRRLDLARDDDDYSYQVRIVNGATILAADTSGGAYAPATAIAVTTTAETTDTVSFSYVNTGASKATWDGATVEFQQTYAKTKGGDGTKVIYDTILLVGTYTSSTTQQTHKIGRAHV